jgi:hypothetical protein
MKLIGTEAVILNMTMRVKAAEGKLGKIAWNAGRLIERRAKENITGKHGHEKHIITGMLRSSIDAKKPLRLSQYRYAVPIGTDVHYAPYVEHRDKTGGYLRPALVEAKGQAIDYIRRSLRGELGLL